MRDRLPTAIGLQEVLRVLVEERILKISGGWPMINVIIGHQRQIEI
jgi:hypothetical protein